MRYGTRAYRVSPSAADGGGGTRQDQRTVGLRSRWDRDLGDGAALFVSGEYAASGAQGPGADGRDGTLNDRRWLAATGMELRAGDHALEMAFQAERFRFDRWDDGMLLYGGASVPGPGMDGDGPMIYGVSAADRWRAGTRATVDYGFGYRRQSGTGAASLLPRVGLTLTPTGVDGVTLRSELMLAMEDASAADRLGYLVGVERRPEDRLQVAASYSYRPSGEPVAAGGAYAGPFAPDDTPLLLADASTARRELEVELARVFGSFRGRLAGRVGRAEGRLTPAMAAAPIQILTDGEARYYQTQLWASYAPTETELQVDYRMVESEESGAGPSVDPLAYRRLDLVVYQPIPGPRALGDARMRVLMAYQGLDYDSVFDGWSGAPISGRSSRLTGGLDISF